MGRLASVSIVRPVLDASKPSPIDRPFNVDGGSRGFASGSAAFLAGRPKWATLAQTLLSGDWKVPP
jgi:hypothetical protein